MVTNWLISFVRTVVAPLVAGYLGQLALFSWADDDVKLRSAVAVLFGAAWYIFARLMQLWNPFFGFLLIVAAKPRYSDAHDDDGLHVSIVRTVVPLAVATTLGYLVANAAGVSTLASCAVAVLAYYGVLRLIEERSAPESTARNVTGWMLGTPAVPYY